MAEHVKLGETLADLIQGPVGILTSCRTDTGKQNACLAV
jgi:hypothetical protein